MTRSVKSIAAALVATSLMAVAAGATTMVRMSLEQLAQASSVIVRGHVVTSESRWSADRSRIETFTTVAVDQVMKGEPGATVVVQQLGGSVGNRHVFVPGSAQLVALESYVLFLEPAEQARPTGRAGRTAPAGEGAANYVVVGMEQGALRVTEDATTGRESVIQPAGEFHIGATAGTTAQAMPLAQFRQGLANAASAPIAIPRGTSFPVVIESTEPAGAGRLQLLGRVARDVFPTAKSIIPASSAVAGRAVLVDGVWKIRWSQVLVRGAEVHIQARNEESNGGGALRGRTLLLQVR